MRNFFGQNHANAALTSLVLAGLIAVIPFLLPHHGLATSFYSEWTAFTLGIVACFPFLLKTFWLDLEVPRITIWLVVVAAFIALQTLFVDQPYVTQALLPGIYIVWAMVLVVLCAWIRKQLGLELSVFVLAWMVLIGGGLHAIIALVQYFDVSGTLINVVDQKRISTHGNIGQRNHFATQITLASFALVYLHASDRINRMFAIALLVLFALVLTASSSRAAAVYVAAGFVLSLVVYHATKTLVHRRLLQGTGLLLVAFLVFQHVLPFLNDWLKLLLDTLGFNTHGFDILVMLQRNAADGVDVRISEWRKAWMMFMESPLWGVGIGNYGWYSFNYQALPEFAAVPQGVLFHHSHNLVMQVLAELGIAGLLMLLLLAMTWLHHVLPHWKSPSHWLIFAFAIVLLLHSSVEYPLWYNYFLGIAAILLGLGSEGTLKIKFTPGLGQFTTGVMLIFSCAILLITLLGVQHLYRIPQLVITTTPQQAYATLHAISKNPLLTPWAEVAIALYGESDKKSIENHLPLTARVVQYRPTPHNVNRRIIYLVWAGKSSEATALMKKAFIVYPEDFSKLACNWKATPVKEVQHLWNEADKLTGGTIECQTETKTSASPS